MNINMAIVNKAWAPNSLEEFIQAYNQGLSDDELAIKFNGTYSTVRKYARRLREKGLIVARKFITLDADKTEEILAMHGVDPSTFEAQAVWAKTDEASVLLKRKGVDWEAILSKLADRAPKYPTIVRPKTRTKRMLEPALYDLHLGKYAWGEESGQNYDLDIACDGYRKAMKSLFSRFTGETFDKVLLVWGQDLSHVDNRAGTTTKGTPLDYDTRFEKIVQTAVELGVETIEHARMFGPVEVLSIPGNHGRHADFMICMVLDAYFRNCPDVTFDLSPKQRKYRQFGKVGLGFSHGDGFKPDKLPLIFATEAADIWGATTYREFRHGHLHFNSVKEFPGCLLRQFPSLSGRDAWHYNNGFVSGKREAQMLVWHEKDGLEAVYSHFI